MRSTFTTAVLAAALAQPASAAGPVCALLDPEKAPRAALLEAKLVADPGATWVERAGIDAVLREQKLQALFSPQGVGDRVRLGKLLKADVLVLVRPVKDAPEPALEVVVGETTGGLRLLVRAVPVTKDQDADVAALLAAVRDGVRRHGEEVREVVAVPPFVSNDLEFTRDHLKGALAKLAEAEALGRRGVVVVELEEAEALAKEIALAAPGSRLARPLPVYLLGEYRHDGKGKDVKVFVKLRAERGGKPVGKPGAEILRPEAAPGAVRAWAAGVLDGLAADAGPRPPADPRAEARQLADRARTFARLSNWVEALALIEASLLLDADQTPLHAQAIKAFTPLLRAAWPKSQKEVAGAERMAVLYRRALAHLDAFFARGGNPADYREKAGGGFVADLFVSVNGLVFTGQPPKGTIAIYEELRKDEREVLLRVAVIEAKSRGREEGFYIWRALNHLPPKEKYEALEKIIIDLRELPNPAARVVAYASLGQANPPDTPEYRAFLDRLAKSDDKALQQAADTLRPRVGKKTPDLPAAVGPGPAGIKFTPIPLDFGGTPADPRTPALGGVLAVGGGTDVLWSRQTLYVMKEKGKPRPAWSETGADAGVYGFSSVGFDGKYLWATLPQRQGRPVIVVLDPRSEKVWDVSDAEGIPSAPDVRDVGGLKRPFVAAAPLDPGRACLAGSFHGRAWVGVATFDPTAGKASVKIIHEARDAPDRADGDQWKKTTVAFKPMLVVAVAGKRGADGATERRVLIGRDVEENIPIRAAPLVVDPDRGTAEVMAGEGWGSVTQYKVLVADGSAYLVLWTGREKKLFRVSLPGPTREAVGPDLPVDTFTTTGVALHGGRFHVVNGEAPKRVTGPRPEDSRVVPQFRWITVDADGKNSRLVANELTGLRGVWVSSHYGLVTLIEQGATRLPILHAVEIADPAPKK